MNESARDHLWQADSYLVAADDGLAGAVSVGRWTGARGLLGEREAAEMPTRVAWQNVEAAQHCLWEAYIALTEQTLSVVETLIAEVAPLGPAEDLVDGDDERSLRLLALYEQIGELVRSHPPDARKTITVALKELRDLCGVFGFPPPSGSKP